MSNGQVHGRVVAVTGASAGVGRAVVHVFAKQAGRPKDPDQPANLWEPADGRGGHDYGAHGAFDQRGKPRSAQVFASQHHKAFLGAATAAAAAAGLIAAVGRNARRS